MNKKDNQLQPDLKEDEISTLKSELKGREKSIKSLNEKLDINNRMLQDILMEKNELKKKIQEYELKLVDAKLNQYQKLQEQHQKTVHRLQVTKKHLDNANIKNKDLQAKEMVMQMVIEDLVKRGFLDHIRNRYPESYLEYKGE